MSKIPNFKLRLVVVYAIGMVSVIEISKLEFIWNLVLEFWEFA
jgi:hypothetical protein